MSVLVRPSGALARAVARPTRYREGVLAILEQLMRLQPPARRLLDFGAGDGWFTSRLRDRGLATFAIGVDVLSSANSVSRPLLYDGKRLPFADRAFDVTCALDVLHHCPVPEDALAEVARCTSRTLVVKDHTYRGASGWLALAVLDELGNRRFGVPSPRHYQREWAWNATLQECGFVLRHMVHPAPCHSGLLGTLTNGLQFVAVWERPIA